MQFQYSPYMLPLIGAAIISSWVAVYAWRHRDTRSAPALAALAVVIALWTAGYALEIGGADLSTKLFWGKVQYFSIVSVPVLWYIFAYDYFHQDKQITPRAIALLFIVPLITVVLVWTTEAHGLVWREVRINENGSFSALGVSYGLWFWIHSAYSYILLLAGTIFILRSLRRTQTVYREQAVALLVAVFAPWIGNILYLSGLSPIPYLDLTPFAFTISVVALAWAILGFSLLSLAPVARELVVDEMSDAMLVLDVQNRVADINPAAQRLLQISPAQAIGQPIADLLRAWPQLAAQYGQVTETQDEITIGEGEDRRWYEVRISPLKDRRKRLVGRVILVRNITERRQTADRLQQERNLLRTVIDNVPDPIFVRDVDGRYLLCNESDAHALGVNRPEEVLGKTDFDFYPHALATQFQMDNQAILASGQPIVNREERSRDQDGEPRWVLTTKVPLRDPQGQITGLVSIARDVTDRKQAEEFRQSFLEDMKALQEIHLALSEIDQLDTLYIKMIDLAQQRLRLDRVGLFMVNTAARELTGTYGVDQHGQHRDEHYYHEAMTPDHWTQDVLNTPEHIKLWENAPLLDNGHIVGTGWKAAAVLWNGHQAIGYLVCDNFLTHKPARPYEAELLSLLGGTFGHLIERLQMEATLRESEERYRNVTESMSDVVWLLDVNSMRFTYVSPSVVRLCGYTVEEMLARSLDQVMTPESLGYIQANLPAHIAAYLAGDQQAAMAITEVEQYHKEGSTVWTEVVTVLQGDAQSGFKVLGVSRDVSERKRADAQIRQLSRAVEASPTSIVITDTLGNIQYVNPKFTEVTGYTVQEVIGQNPRILKTDLTPRKVHQDMWQTLLAGREWHGEFCNRKKSGELYWEWASISPIVDAGGHPMYYVAVKEDITERKHAQEELAIAHDQALAASRYKSELLAKVSHELRTPLGAILGYAEFLHNEMFAPLTAQQKHFTAEILDSVKYLTSLVNDLLDEAQIERGQITIQAAPFNLRPMIDQLNTALKPTAEAKGLALTFDVSTAIPVYLNGDQKRIRQILINLINNAIKFTTAGSVAVQIDRANAYQWRIRVSDTGPGIPAETQAKVFETFWQADGTATRQHRGYGLGLAIVKQLTELMGGEVSLESEVGQGSTFIVTLPLEA
ncbi:MAG TPA: PAS domain S-box protein [Anaerolineae bacterium]|nr:PAS domain S-box protein [Anaerolineae bacterium]